MKTHKKHGILYAATCILTSLILLDLLLGFFLMRQAIGRKSATDRKPFSVSGYEAIYQESLQWEGDREYETVSLTSSDGLSLHANYYPAANISHYYAILVHGYTGSRKEMLPYAVAYAERGYNLLIPDLRAHGESEGRYIGMGWLDRMDLIQWIDCILEWDADAEIVLHGVSMGAATVLMTTGEDLPCQVKAIVADCAYTSAWDLFSRLLGGMDWPILNTANVLVRGLAGYDLHQASPLEQVQTAKVPILFIHGDADELIPVDMARQLFDACSAEKKLLIVENAAHAKSMYEATELYFKTVFDFINDIQ